jgi:hypothetical protein
MLSFPFVSYYSVWRISSPTSLSFIWLECRCSLLTLWLLDAFIWIIFKSIMKNSFHSLSFYTFGWLLLNLMGNPGDNTIRLLHSWRISGLICSFSNRSLFLWWAYHSYLYICWTILRDMTVSLINVASRYLVVWLYD